MISSKNILVLVSALFFTAACSTESRKKNEFVMGAATDFDKSAQTTFRVNTVAHADVQIVQKNKYSMPEKKQYTFTACLQDATGTNLPPDLTFSIEDGAGGSIRKVTNFGGCLSWQETHSFNVLGDEKYFRLQRTITAITAHKGSVKVDLAFNPWNDSKPIIDPRTVEKLPGDSKPVDLGAMSLNGGSFKSDDNKPLNVNVETIGFEFQGLDFENYRISRNLNLSVAHKYLISLKPSVLRNTISKTGVPEAFVGGEMKLYMALFREVPGSDPFANDNLIQVIETTLADKNLSGRFIAQTSVRFDNIADLTSRTQVLVTLVPDDVSVGELKFSGVLKPGRLANLALIPSELSAKSMLTVSQNRPSELERNPLDVFIKDSGFRPLSGEIVSGELLRTGFFSRQKADVNLTAELLSYLSGQTKKLSGDAEQALCVKVLGPQDPRFKSCLRSPLDFVAYGKREFIDEITTAPKQIGVTTTETMSMNMTIAMSRQRLTTSTARINGGAGLSVGIGSGGDYKYGRLEVCPPPNTDPQKMCPVTTFEPKQLGKNLFGGLSGFLNVKLNLNAGMDYALARAWTSSDNETNTISVTSKSDVTSEGNTFEFKAKSTSCVLVTERISQANNTNELRSGQYLCTQNAEEKTLTESYYLIGQNNGNAGSMFSDSESASSTPWRMFVRGRSTALLLYNAIKDSNLKSVIERAESSEQAVLKRFQEYTLIQEFPGALQP